MYDTQYNTVLYKQRQCCSTVLYTFIESGHCGWWCLRIRKKRATVLGDPTSILHPNGSVLYHQPPLRAACSHNPRQSDTFKIEPRASPTQHLARQQPSLHNHVSNNPTSSLPLEFPHPHHPRVARLPTMAGQLVLIVLASAAVALASILLSFVAALYVQRRRARAARERQRAAEEAERRRRKRKRAGLRSAEIDAHAPERLVASAFPTPPEPVAGDGDGIEAAADLDDSDDDGSGRGYPPSADKASGPKSGGVGTSAASVGAPASDGGAEGVVEVGARPEPLPTTLAPGEETCAVCLDDLELGNLVRRLPCGHVFHSSCIRQWLRRKNACPCCTAQVVKRKKKKKKRPPTQATSDGRVSVRVTRNANVEGWGSPGGDAGPVDGHVALAVGEAAVGAGSEQDMPLAVGGADVQAHQMAPSLYGSGRLYLGSLADRPVSADRPLRPVGGGPGVYAHPTIPRDGSLLDPENPESDVLASEASSVFDDFVMEEPMDQLLDHVRRVIRGEASQISIGAYSTDMDDDTLDINAIPDMGLPDDLSGAQRTSHV